MLTTTSFSVSSTDRPGPYAVFMLNFTSLVSDQGADFWKWGVIRTDWKDGSPGTWTVGRDGSRTRNISWGFLARHGYNHTPGDADAQYSPEAAVFDGDVIQVLEIGTLNVRDANTYFTNKYAVSPTGTFTDAPAGFTQVTESVYADMINTYQGTRNLVIARGGELLTGPTAEVTCSGNEWCVAGGERWGFGTGNARVNCGHNTNSTNYMSGSSNSEVQFLDFDFEDMEESNAYRVFRSSSSNSDAANNVGVTIKNCNLPDGGYLLLWQNTSDRNVKYLALVDCTVAIGTETTNLQFAVAYGYFDDAWFAGNDFSINNRSADERTHPLRVEQGKRVLIESCKHLGQGNQGTVFKMSAVGPGNKIGVADEIATEDVLLFDCHFVYDLGLDWGVNLHSESSSPSGRDAYIYRVVFDSCFVEVLLLGHCFPTR